MELERALSDLAEVRDRLAQVQRFEGYSGPAAAASGALAIVAGFVQMQLAPIPRTSEELHTYVLIWMSCLGLALLLNYGAVAMWAFKKRGGAQSQFRSAAFLIAPSVLLGGALSVALVDHSAYGVLPGAWFAFYTIGLFASRGVIPQATLAVTFAFAALAILFLVTPLSANALEWWVMPLGFGLGQVTIGALIWKERTA